MVVHLNAELLERFRAIDRMTGHTKKVLLLRDSLLHDAAAIGIEMLGITGMFSLKSVVVETVDDGEEYVIRLRRKQQAKRAPRRETRADAAPLKPIEKSGA